MVLPYKPVEFAGMRLSCSDGNARIPDDFEAIGKQKREGFFIAHSCALVTGREPAARFNRQGKNLQS